MQSMKWIAGVVVGAGLLIAAPARAADPEAIEKAIDKGVKLVKATARDGWWGDVGPTALNALALLECDVPEDDPILVKAAEHIRRHSVNETRTYSMSLCILFLDRFRDPGDVPLIESLAVRLMEGQDTSGGWPYNCPPNSADETRRLEATIKDRSAALATRRDARPGARRTVKDLPEPIQAQLARLVAAPEDKKHRSDNSNTQFAIFALWVAHRHGIPIDEAIVRIEYRMRMSQLADGGWAYNSDPQRPGTPFGDKPKTVGESGSTATMTCAGLTGLMITHGLLAEKGNTKKAGDIKADQAVKVGLINLASMLRKPLKRGAKELPHVGGRSYYFLWSMERVCVGLGLQTLGRKDWYAWGADFLVNTQHPDGAWRGEFGGNNADTCFALLFLKRANLVRDLTAELGPKFRGFEDRKPEVGGPVSTKPPVTTVPDVDPDTRPSPTEKPVDPKPVDAKPPDVKPPEPKPVDPVPSEPPPKPKPLPADSPAAKLAEDFLREPGETQALALARLRDGKGVQFTEALTEAIHRLDGIRKDQVRKALVERLARMKPDTLRRYLSDELPEIRRAAALASASKDLTSHIPDVIVLLRDRNPDVSRAAYAAVKSLSGQNLPDDPAAWEEWWKRQNK
jgi:hypothetical protein